MKSITINFANQEVLRIDKIKIGIKSTDGLEKSVLDNFYPALYYRDVYMCFTWDFQNERFICNRDCNKKRIFSIWGTGYNPEVIIQMEGLSRQYLEFVSLLSENGIEV